jgi:xylulokinase
MANATGLALDVPVAGDFGGAFGAARLAVMAAEHVDAQIASQPAINYTIEPDPALEDAFRDGHEKYRAASSAIRRLKA